MRKLVATPFSSAYRSSFSFSRARSVSAALRAIGRLADMGATLLVQPHAVPAWRTLAE